ncbi:MAG: phosphonate ABC transporter, permease protein PhnE [Rhizobiales bacterium]|nr:phosphonate ABC transporter, permease protein PhnE [Hyphomicrobiales bacterium]
MAFDRAELLRAQHLFPHLFEAAPGRRAKHVLIALGVLGYILFCLWYFEITWVRLFGGLDKMGHVIRAMVTWKDFWGWDFAGIGLGLAQTLGMAFLGTFVASLFALPLGFLGAGNVVTFAPLRHVVRRMLDVFRGVDQLIWALVYVRAVGLGPLAGVLAIMTSDTGVLGKLYAEAIENIDRKQVEGVKAVGAHPLALHRFGTLPQVIPVFLAQSLYFFESNTRSATILGIVGAGGIGMQLSERMRVQYWDQACFIIILILIMVGAIDWLSGKLRRHFIGKRDL